MASDGGNRSSTPSAAILFCFIAGTFKSHASLSLQTESGACRHPTVPFANTGVRPRALYRGGTGSAGREGANGDEDGVGDRDGNGDRDGAGTGTGVETRKRTQSGNGMAAGTETRAAVETGTETGAGTGTGVETRTGTKMERKGWKEESSGIRRPSSAIPHAVLSLKTGDGACR